MRFAASLCALLIGGVTFDGSTKDAVQCDVRDALVALKAATTQAQAQATRQRAGIAHATANGGRWHAKSVSNILARTF